MTSAAAVASMPFGTADMRQRCRYQYTMPATKKNADTPRSGMERPTELRGPQGLRRQPGPSRATAPAHLGLTVDATHAPHTISRSRGARKKRPSKVQASI